MVRIKRRYLVVRFLYPKAPSDCRNRQVEFQFHQPTPDALTVPLFLRSIRNNVEELFGDYGSGVVAGNLSGMVLLSIFEGIYCFYASVPLYGRAHIKKLCMFHYIFAKVFHVVKYLSNPTSTAVICVSRDHYRLVWAALSLMNRLPKPINQECVIRVIKVSGTIRKALEWLVMNSKEHIATLNTKAQNGNSGTLLTGTIEDNSASR